MYIFKFKKKKSAVTDCLANKKDMTELHFATIARDHDLIRSLLDQGYDPNYQSANGCTPMHIAAQIDSGTGLGIFLHHEPQPNLFLRTIDGDSILDLFMAQIADKNIYLAKALDDAEVL